MKTKHQFNYKANLVIFNTPYQFNYTSSCGGTLIDKNVILSAAHCIPKRATFYFMNVLYGYNIRVNNFYPTWESMFTIYLGKKKYMLRKLKPLHLMYKPLIIIERTSGQIQLK